MKIYVKLYNHLCKFACKSNWPKNTLEFFGSFHNSPLRELTKAVEKLTGARLCKGIWYTKKHHSIITTTLVNNSIIIMFKRNYFRVFDNLLMQEKLVYPTLGKEELNLSIGPMALTVAEVTTTSLLLFIIFSLNSSSSLGLWLRRCVTHLYCHFCPCIFLMMGGTSNLL